MRTPNNARILILLLALATGSAAAVSCEKETPDTAQNGYVYADNWTEYFGKGTDTTVLVTIHTNIPADAIKIESESWITARVKTVDLTTRNGLLEVHVTHNGRQAKRSGEVRISGMADNSMPAAYKVRQDFIVNNKEGMVPFKDMEFKAAMLAAADKDGDGDISPKEALDVIEVNATGMGIKDISGIEYFKNVTKIDFQDNDITDATAIKDHPYLHWVDLKGNKNLKTFDVTGCTFYFDHCEFEVTEDLLYYCWRRQVNITATSDRHCEHSKHIKDTRETTDWSRQNRIVKVMEHTKGDGHAKICFTGIGYINTDLEDGTFERIMKEGIEYFFTCCPDYVRDKEYFDVYYMERLAPIRDKWICNENEVFTEYYTFSDSYRKNTYYPWVEEIVDAYKTSWEKITETEVITDNEGKVVGYMNNGTVTETPNCKLLTVFLDVNGCAYGPYINGYEIENRVPVFTFEHNNQWHIQKNLNTWPEKGENGEVEYAYANSTSPKNILATSEYKEAYRWLVPSWY